jgi:hypothetical protein
MDSISAPRTSARPMSHPNPRPSKRVPRGPRWASRRRHHRAR